MRKGMMHRFGSRSREIGEVKDSIHRIETRLGRQGGNINGAELARRLDKLEGKKE